MNSIFKRGVDGEGDRKCLAQDSFELFQGCWGEEGWVSCGFGVAVVKSELPESKEWAACGGNHAIGNYDCPPTLEVSG